jgi:hypothetical protein
MTLHFTLLTPDSDGCPDGFVWAVDRKASFGWGQEADIEKIRKDQLPEGVPDRLQRLGVALLSRCETSLLRR